MKAKRIRNKYEEYGLDSNGTYRSFVDYYWNVWMVTYYSKQYGERSPAN